jgi:hypothetical protein
MSIERTAEETQRFHKELASLAKGRASHTPGPWSERTRTLITLDGCDQREEVIEIGRTETDETPCYVPFAIEGQSIATPSGRTEADARLIAAAPEMRETLVMALAELRDCSELAGDDDRWNEGGNGYEAVMQIKALLARLDGAEG